MEGIERMNAMVVRGAGQGVGAPPRRDPYVMEVDSIVATTRHKVQ